MPQQPRHHVIHVRIRDELRRKLEREASKHHFSLNNEVRIRLEDSFARGDALRTVDDAAMDMQIAWAKFSARFLRMELGDQLADAVAKGEDPQTIKTLARLIIEHRAVEQSSPGSMS